MSPSTSPMRTWEGGAAGSAHPAPQHLVAVTAPSGRPHADKATARGIWVPLALPKGSAGPGLALIYFPGDSGPRNPASGLTVAPELGQRGLRGQSGAWAPPPGPDPLSWTVHQGSMELTALWLVASGATQLHSITGLEKGPVSALGVAHSPPEGQFKAGPAARKWEC